MNPYRKIAGLGCACLVPGLGSVDPYRRLAGVGSPYRRLAGVGSSNVDVGTAVDYAVDVAGLNAIIKLMGDFERASRALEADADRLQFSPLPEHANAHIATVEALIERLDSILAGLQLHANRWKKTTPKIQASYGQLMDAVEKLSRLAEQALAQSREATDKARAAADAGDHHNAQAWLNEAERLAAQARQANELAEQGNQATGQYLNVVRDVISANEASLTAASAAHKSVSFALSRAEAAIEEAYRGVFQEHTKQALGHAKDSIAAGERAVEIAKRLLEDSRSPIDDLIDAGTQIGTGLLWIIGLLVAVSAAQSFSKKS